MVNILAIMTMIMKSSLMKSPSCLSQVGADFRTTDMDTTV